MLVVIIHVNCSKKEFTMRQVIRLVGCYLITMSSFASICVAAEKASKPNIVIVFIDDQGYQDLGCFGSPNIKTPNIDNMATEGMKFTNFYVAASVCSPSRASLLTGRYPERNGVLRVLFPNQTTGLNPKEVTIAEMLKKSGYSTSCIGKWHLGDKAAFLPTNQGFDSYYGIPYSNGMWIDPQLKISQDAKLGKGITRELIKKKTGRKKKSLVPLMRNDEVIEYPCEQSTITKRYTEEAVKFITENKNKPFFLYLAHSMPHVPLYVSKDFEGKSDAGLYGDSIEEIDWSVGQVLKALKDNGVDKNTLVIYTSDNGPGHFKNNKKDKVKGNMARRVGGSALPLKGYKFKCWEGGMRVPCVIRWPSKIPAGKICKEVAGTIDLLPTIAAITGAGLPENRIIDGKNIISLMQGKEGAKTPHTAYFYRTTAVRSGNWKLHGKELFDLSKDISEKNNVATSYPEIVEKLRLLLKEHKANLKKSANPLGDTKKNNF